MEHLWQCPKCRRRFANRNQEHSCGRYTVKEFLQGKTPNTVALYSRFEQMVRELGPVILAPAKTRVGFQARMIFAAVNKLTSDRLDAHVILARRLENPRFTKIQSLSPRSHVHHFQIRQVNELDDEVKSWLEEAYKVGLQHHLTDTRKK
jgi:hypothetical protein